jgi:5-methylcytosine-specific restriction endonuclease McrA
MRTRKLRHDMPELQRQVLLRLAAQKWGWFCCFCGLQLNAPDEPSVTPLVTTLEHIVPKSQGGTDSVENLGLACECCNRAKRAMSAGQFLQWLNHVRSTNWSPIRDGGPHQR